HRSSVKFLCRENNFTCEEILSTSSSVKSNGTFTLTGTNRGFSVSISNVSSHDAGLYWCGVNKGNYQTGLRKIQLEVEGDQCCLSTDIRTFTKNVTITVREVTADDSGTYWCGAESTDRRRSNTFFHRCLLTVGEWSHYFIVWISVLTVTIVVVICVVVLALLLIVLFFYKGKRFPDRTYEEIQELPQKPDSGTALKTIYVTANFPTNPSSAPHHHSNINFQSSSGDVGGNTYFTVNDGDQHPTYSTVNHPSRSSADPFYSTVNKPQ
uniref:Immunoglobulin V-set domain-containing protein n=1 Tax=Dicentrarchus labrax TaxID=13489 RepID=A0A8P4K8X7_DICLA